MRIWDCRLQFHQKDVTPDSFRNRYAFDFSVPTLYICLKSTAIQMSFSTVAMRAVDKHVQGPPAKAL